MGSITLFSQRLVVRDNFEVSRYWLPNFKLGKMQLQAISLQSTIVCRFGWLMASASSGTYRTQNPKEFAILLGQESMTEVAVLYCISVFHQF